MWPARSELEGQLLGMRKVNCFKQYMAINSTQNCTQALLIGNVTELLKYLLVEMNFVAKTFVKTILLLISE